MVLGYLFIVSKPNLNALDQSWLMTSWELEGTGNTIFVKLLFMFSNGVKSRMWRKKIYVFTQVRYVRYWFYISEKAIEDGTNKSRLLHLPQVPSTLAKRYMTNMGNEILKLNT